MPPHPRRRRWLWLTALLTGIAALAVYWATDDYVPTDADLRWWGNLALWSIAPPLFGFVGWYGIRSRWWSTPEGRAVFFLTGSLLLLFVLILLPQIFGADYTGRYYLRIVGFGAVSATMYNLFIALIRSQRPPRRTMILTEKEPE